MKKKSKLKPMAKEIDEVAVLLQKLVRLKAKDKKGLVQCVTCDNKLHWKNMQGGHFIERAKKSTKILEENIHPQCPACNQYGMKYKTEVRVNYHRYMEDMYGREFIIELINLSKQVFHITRQELRELKQRYKQQIKELING